MTTRYDAEGRLTQRRDRGTGGVTRYTWSDAGRLTSITAPNGATSTYRYDAFGRRLEANDDGTVRRFVYSGWNLRNEFDGANALRATYVAGLFPDSVYEIVRDGARYYPLFDGVGSVTTLTDATGAAVGRVRYSVFGIPQSSGVTEAAVSFTGHQFDAATGLVYARARYYDPTLGRFLSQDPVPAINPYVYASDKPMDAVNLTGAAATAENVQTRSISLPSWRAGTRARNFRFFLCADAVILQRLYVNVFFGIPLNVGQVIDVTEHVLSECRAYL